MSLRHSSPTMPTPCQVSSEESRSSVVDMHFAPVVSANTNSGPKHRLRIAMIVSISTALACLRISEALSTFPADSDGTPLSGGILLNNRTSPLRSLRTIEASTVNSMNQLNKKINNDTRETDNVIIMTQLYDDGTVGCSISGKLNYLDCGFGGHIYTAEMDCPGKQRKRTILKVKTKLVNETNPKGPRMYTSFESTEVQRNQVLHKQLFSNATKEFRSYFAVPLGMAVNISHGLLHEGIKQANEDCVKGRYDGLVHSTNSEHTVLQGSVLPFISGKNLCGILAENPSTGMRQQIVRGLVKMYRHMYERQILHCDISCYHFMISGGQTTLIDFERYMIATNDPHLKDRQHTQLWQLLFLIGDVCTDKTGDESEMKFGVPMNSCNLQRKGDFNPASMMKRLVSAMNKCGFERNFTWRNETLENAKRTYNDLAKWSISSMARARASVVVPS